MKNRGQLDCPQCGAVVGVSSQDLHKRWHTNLEIAILQASEEKQ